MAKKFLYSALILLLLTIILMIISALRSEKFQLVQISGIESCSNSPIYYAETIGINSDSISALPLHNNDIICLFIQESIAFYQYEKSDGTNLVFKNEGFKLYLNNDLIDITISDDPKVLEWLKSTNLAKETTLRSLAIEGPLPDEYFVELEKLSDIKPNLGLVLRDSKISTDEILKIFNPKYFYVLEYSDQQAQLIYEADNLEYLYIHNSLLDYSRINELSNLKNLVILEFDPGNVNVKLPASLKRLSIVESNIKDLKVIEALSNLEELKLISCLDLKDISGISNLDRLRRISINYCEDLTDFAPLLGITRLTELGLPSTIEQLDFDNILKQQKDLKILELRECDEIKNLDIINSIPKLSCLSLFEMEVDPESIIRLDKLNYLAYPENWDPDTVEKLEKALPNAIILPISAVCLGSVWLLLIVPCFLLLYLFRFLFKKRDLV